MADNRGSRIDSVPAGPRFSAAGILVGGCLAGIFAAIIMGAVATWYGGRSGAGGSILWQMIAGTFYGPMAFVGGSGVTAIGVITHLATGGLLGIVFAAITARINPGIMVFVLGFVYGVAVWAFMSYVILPNFDHTMLVRIPTMSAFWFWVHWVYGGFLGLFLPGLRGAFGKNRRTLAPQPLPIA